MVDRSQLGYDASGLRRPNQDAIPKVRQIMGDKTPKHPPKAKKPKPATTPPVKG
jgi:hypothetical protein